MDNYIILYGFVGVIEKNDMVLNSSIFSVEVNKLEWYIIIIYRIVYVMVDLC